MGMGSNGWMTIVIWLVRLFPIALCALFRNLEKKIIYNMSSSFILLHDLLFRFLIGIAAFLSQWFLSDYGASFDDSVITFLLFLPCVFYIVGELWTKKQPFLCVPENSKQFRYQAVSEKLFRFNLGYSTVLYEKIKTIPQYDAAVDCFMLYRLKPSFEKLYSRILSKKADEIIPEISYAIMAYPDELSDRVSNWKCSDENRERLAKIITDGIQALNNY